MKTKNEEMNATKKGIFSNKIVKTTLAMFVAFIFASCTTSADKLDNAQEDATEAQAELDKAQAEYEADVEKYRLHVNENISDNEKYISDINMKIQSSNSMEKAEYEKQIFVLEQKNKDYEKKMNQYESKNKKDWENFKTEFSDDMDDLGQALKNFTVN